MSFSSVAKNLQIMLGADIAPLNVCIAYTERVPSAQCCAGVKVRFAVNPLKLPAMVFLVSASYISNVELPGITLVMTSACVGSVGIGG